MAAVNVEERDQVLRAWRAARRGPARSQPGSRRGGVPRTDGPLGSGKTTLLNLVAGSIDLDRDIVVAGERISTHCRGNSHAGARHVGYVFQFYNLMPLLTAEQNVELLPALTNFEGAAQRHRPHCAAPRGPE